MKRTIINKLVWPIFLKKLYKTILLIKMNQNSLGLSPPQKKSLHYKIFVLATDKRPPLTRRCKAGKMCPYGSVFLLSDVFIHRWTLSTYFFFKLFFSGEADCCSWLTPGWNVILPNGLGTELFIKRR